MEGKEVNLNTEKMLCGREKEKRVDRGRVSKKWGDLIPRFKFNANWVRRDEGYQREKFRWQNWEL